MPTGHWRGALRSLAEAGDPGARKPPQPETSKRPTTIAPRWVGACGDSCPTSNSKPVVRKGCYRARAPRPAAGYFARGQRAPCWQAAVWMEPDDRMAPATPDGFGSWRVRVVPADQLVQCGAALGIWAGWAAAQKHEAATAKRWAAERLRQRLRRWAEAGSWRRQVQLAQAWCGRFRGFRRLSLRARVATARLREDASAAHHARHGMLCHGFRAWDVAARARQRVARAASSGPDAGARARRACRNALVRWLSRQRSRAEAQVLSSVAAAVALTLAVARWATAAAARARALFAGKQVRRRCTASAFARALAAWASALAAARVGRELCAAGGLCAVRPQLHSLLPATHHYGPPTTTEYLLLLTTHHY